MQAKRQGCEASVSNDSLECSDDYHDDEYCESCNNTGMILVCIDDMCHGLGYCIHGDGEITCPTCKGVSA